MEIDVSIITLRWINCVSTQFEISLVSENHKVSNTYNKSENNNRFAAASLSRTVPPTTFALRSNPEEKADKYFTIHTLALSILRHKTRACVVFTMSYNIQ